MNPNAPGLQVPFPMPSWIGWQRSWLALQNEVAVTLDTRGSDVRGDDRGLRTEASCAALMQHG
jgi:hypothetical protein